LRLLKEAGLVVEHKRARENLYSLNRPKLKALSAWLELYWGSAVEQLRADEPQRKSQLELDL